MQKLTKIIENILRVKNHYSRILQVTDSTKEEKAANICVIFKNPAA